MANILLARFGRGFQALFNLNQPLTLGEALPDVLASLDVMHPSVDLETFFGIDRAMGVGDQAAVAAEFSQVNLFMPAGRGKIATVDSVLLNVATTTTLSLHLGSGTPPGTVATTAQITDMRRNNLGGSPAAQIITESAAAAGTSPIYLGRLLQNTNYLIPIRACLAESNGVGTFLRAQCDVANVALTATFHWTERALGPQEARP